MNEDSSRKTHNCNLILFLPLCIRLQHKQYLYRNIILEQCTKAQLTCVLCLYSKPSKGREEAEAKHYLYQCFLPLHVRYGLVLYIKSITMRITLKGGVWKNTEVKKNRKRSLSCVRAFSNCLCFAYTSPLFSYTD